MEKRIVFFIGEFSEGGAERVISILANNLAERDYSVEVLKYFRGENFYITNEKVKIVCVEEETNSTSLLTNSKWIGKHFKDNAYIVISFLAKFNMLAIHSNRKNDIPIIVCDRNDPRYTPTNVILRKARNILYKKADRVVLQTEHNKDYFNGIKDKCVVIPNPIDMGDYVGKALETPKEDLIVSAGRLEPQKNQMMLIDAFSEIREYFPGYKLKIFGEGSYRSELENRIRKLNLEDSVSLPGQVSDIFDEMCKAKLFVLPSDYEGMPNVLIEAMCLGLPCISTKVSGANELIKDGINGYLISTKDKDALKKKIQEILSDNELSKNISNKALSIEKVLCIDNVRKSWNELIESVTA